MRKGTTILLGFCLLLASASFAQVIKTKTVPEFTLPDLDGKKITMSEELGSGPVYISFWGTKCKPCIDELKIIQKLYAEYAEKGFKVLAINTDGPRTMGRIKSMVRSNRFTFTVLLDADKEVFQRRFKGFALPFSVMADPQGNVIFSSVGFKPGDEVEVEKLILEHMPEAAEDEALPTDDESESEK